MLSAKLVVVGGDAKSTEVKLKLPTVIGRGKEAGLTVPHALVSRRHTEVYEKEGRLFVRDLGSLNGTFVNNQKIDGEQLLAPNQLLTLGNITFRAVYEILDESRADEDRTTTPETVRFEELRTERDASAVPKTDFDETVPVDSLSALAGLSEVSAISGLSAVADVSEANSVAAAEATPRNRLERKTQPEPAVDQPVNVRDEVSAAHAKPAAKPASEAPVEASEIPPSQSNSKPQDHEIGIDLDSDIFSLDSDQPVPGSVSVSALGSLDVDETPASFVGQVDLGIHEASPDSVESSVRINLGEDKTSHGDVDESRLGSFLKNLDQ